MAEAKKKTTTKKTTKPAAKTATKPISKVTAKPAEKKKCSKCAVFAIVAAVVAVLAIIATIFCLVISGNKIAGKYNLTGMVADGEDQSSSLSLMQAFGLTASLEMKDDGTCVMNLFGEETSECTYDKGAKTITLDGDKASYTFDKDAITIEQDGTSMTFTRAED